MPSKLRVWLDKQREVMRAGPVYDADAIRRKRPNGMLPLSMGRLCFVVPFSVKSEVLRWCREEGVTQAELGLLMVELALQRDAELRAAIVQMRGRDLKVEKGYLDM